MGGGDVNVGNAVPTNSETNSGDGNDNNVLDENRNNVGVNDVCDDANVVGKSSIDGDNGDGGNLDGIDNSNGGNDSSYVSNLPVSSEVVGEIKKKKETEQQSKGGGDKNVGLDVPNHNATHSGDDNDSVLDENRKNKGGKDVCNDANNVGKSCNGDNGDGENSDGIVNNIGGNNSNDVGYPPDSGDAVGERKKQVKTGLQSKGGDDDNIGVDGPNHDDTNRGGDHDNVLDENRNDYEGKDIWDDDNVVNKTCDGDNGDGDNRNDSVNNICDNDSTEVVIPPDRGGDAVGEVISVSGTYPCPRSPMVIDYESKFMYPSTEDSLRQVCGFTTTFQKITCGYGIFPLKHIRQSPKNAHIKD